MEWKDLATTVGKVAPVLGTVLGGPVGTIAGTAGALICNLFGDDVEPTPKAILKAINGDPESMLKLRQLEVDEKLQLMRLQEKQIEADLENVKSARKRETILTKSGSASGWIPPAIISTVITIGFGFMVYYVLSMTTEPSQAAVLMLGILGTGFTAVINYYLGSSAGSARKDNMVQGKG